MTLSTYTAGEKLTAASLNLIVSDVNDNTADVATNTADIATNTADIADLGTWTSFTPSWSFSSGSLTLTDNTGAYAIINELIVIQTHFRVTSISGTGNLELTLPSNLALNLSLFAYYTVGFGWCRDASASQHYLGGPYMTNSTTVLNFRGLPGDAFTHAYPIAWATDDEFDMTITGRTA